MTATTAVARNLQPDLVNGVGRLHSPRGLRCNEPEPYRGGRSAEIFLRQAGFEVILADDGFDALAKISDHRPQVIFVDIMMPRLDGYQTCALIKQNPLLKSTPVIMLSSKDGVFDRARGRLAGSDRYLTKPFTKEGLIDAVNEYAKAPPVSS
jgi:twitching motility two-component system response regulator PilG